MTLIEQIVGFTNRTKRRLFRNIFLTRLLLLAFATGLSLIAIFVFFLPVIRVGKDLLFGKADLLAAVFQEVKIKETGGRTNILILGTGGGNHEGRDLTDSMVVVSFVSDATKNNLKENSVTLISVPRDIYLESLPGKINAAYDDGEKKEKGAGLILAKGAVSQILGIPIHYAVQADFSAFQETIDLLGGIEVNVLHSLTDKSYPIEGKEDDLCGKTDSEVNSFLLTNPTEPEQWDFFSCRYEVLRFDKGKQHMNGETALKFVRSRHAEGDEGTDFARSRRQQLVLAAVQNKFLSTNVLLDPKKIEDIYLVIKSRIDTDLTSREIKDLVPVILEYRKANIDSLVLDMDFFDNPPIDQRGWILLPKGGDFKQIQKAVSKELEGKE